MNNMNPLYQEMIARQQARELEAEINQIRLQHIAAQANPRADWLAHRIAHFAEWMISTGESLRQRYDHASLHVVEQSQATLSYGGATPGTHGPLYE